MRLLVSVVDAGEACEAVAGGADVIDVKDPRRGALGAASPAAIRGVRAVTPGDWPVSAALGDGPFAPAAAAAARDAVAAGADYVKLGLRNTGGAEALVVLRAVRAAIPREVALIVAGFADAARAGSPPPSELPALAQAAGAQGCLLDTAIKDGRGLLAWLDDTELARFAVACRAAGLLCALAGSLTAADLARLRPVGADLVGVRGAACAGDRVGGRVQAARVRALVAALRDARFLASTSPS